MRHLKENVSLGLLSSSFYFDGLYIHKTPPTNNITNVRLHIPDLYLSTSGTGTGFILFPLVILLADTVENSMTGIAMVTKGGGA